MLIILPAGLFFSSGKAASQMADMTVILRSSKLPKVLSSLSLIGVSDWMT